MIEIRKGSKSYYDTVILKEINVRLKRNNLYLLSGKNGSGKSVFCDIVCGFSKLNSGTYKNTFKSNQIYITNGFAFFDDDSFANVIKFYKRVYNLTSLQIDQYIKLMNLEEYKNNKVSELSSGTKQKIKLIPLFIDDIDFAILDEPFSNLDSESRKIVYLRIEKLRNKNVTMLIVEHDKQINELLKLKGEVLLCQEKVITNF